jgi:hypothetical protein
MAVSLTDLYARLGKLFGIAKSQIDARSTIIDRVQGTGSYTSTGLDGQYTGSTRYMISPVLDYFLNIYRSQDPTIQTVISGGVKTLTEMVYADNSNIPKATQAALAELNRQMRVASTSLLQNTITQGSVSYGAANVGNGKIILHGTPSQMSRSETLTFECVSDTTTGTASGREIFLVRGGQAISDITSYLWPGGSGANVQIASSDYISGQNTLTNGGFDSFTGGVPDNWTVTTGVSNISQLSSGTFRNGSALRFSGTTQTILTQTGSNRILGPNRRLIFGFWAKRVSGTTPPADPIISMDLLNASTGATLSSVDTTTGGSAISTSWQLYVGSYLNSYYAPASDITVQFDINPGVANVYAIDCAFVYAPTQAGTNGQFLQIIGGSTDWRIGDYATVAISNNYASTVLSYTERFFSPFAIGLELPTSGSPTINNSVIP